MCSAHTFRLITEGALAAKIRGRVRLQTGLQSTEIRGSGREAMAIAARSAAVAACRRSSRSTQLEFRVVLATKLGRHERMNLWKISTVVFGAAFAFDSAH